MVAEQIPAAIEQGLLESVLGAARGEGRSPCLLVLRQPFSQPRHGTVDVMQLHRFHSRDRVVLFPVQHARAIAAGGEQAMEHGQKEDAFQGQFETSARQQPFDDLGDLQLVPQPLENQRRADAAMADGRHVAPAVRGKHHHGLSELRSRLQQAVELAAGLQPVQSPYRGDDALSAAAFFPAVLDDLEIDITSGSLLTEEHGGLRAGFLLPP
jgi:hypothetical protein